MKSDYYDRQGRPLTAEEWASMYEIRHTYKRVAETTLPNGRWVSTVWLGMDHNLSRIGPPLIFETMVFAGPEDLSDLDCDRYSTEDEALAGHQRMVNKWTKEAG